MGSSPNRRGMEHSSMPAMSITSPSFLLKDMVNCTHSPESERDGELLVPIKLAWMWPNVTGAHAHMPAKRRECQPFLGGQAGSGTLLGRESIHGWLSSSAFVGWRERNRQSENERAARQRRPKDVFNVHQIMQPSQGPLPGFSARSCLKTA